MGSRSAAVQFGFGNSETKVVSGHSEAKGGIFDQVDLDELRELFEGFTQATGFTIGFLDHPDLNILISTAEPEAGCFSKAACRKSLRQLLENLGQPGKPVIKRCQNGLTACAVPIVVNGKHLASLYSGQYLTEQTEREQVQAWERLFGFDEPDCRKIPGRGPLDSEAELRRLTMFLAEIAWLLLQQGYARLQFTPQLMDRPQPGEALRRSEGPARSRRSVLSAIQEIHSLLRQAKDCDSLLTAVCQSLVKTRGYAGVWVGRPDAKSRQIWPVACSEGAPDFLQGPPVAWDDSPCGRGPTGLAMRHQRPVVFDNLATDPRFAPWREGVAAFQGGAIAAIPIRQGETILGVLTSRSDRPGAFDGEELEFLTVVADDLAWAAHHFGEEVIRRKVEVTNLRLATAVEHSGESIMITDTNGAILYVNPAFEKTTGYTSAEVLGRNPGILKSGRQDGEFYHQLWMALGRGETWSGRFTNRRKDGSLFEEDATISPVRNAAGKIVNYVAVKRDVSERNELEREVLRRIELEQERIGRDLHDGLCQNLVGTKFRSASLARRLSRENLAWAVEEANLIQDILNQTIVQTRDLAKGLNPVRLGADGLACALRELAQTVEATGRTHCFCQVSPVVEITNQDVVNHLYRITQEAVQNALKHGQAENILIALKKQDNDLMLVVEDDGVGFPDAPANSAGMGLHNMKARAGLIGGTLTIQRGSQRGCVAKLKLPAMAGKPA